MALRPCLAEGCGLLTSGTRCIAHEADHRRRQDAKRGPRPWYQGDYPRLRAEAKAAHPYCARCGATAGLEANHVIPRSLEGGLEVLCGPCHARYGARSS